MSETFECPKCGYQWKQGQHGGHSCSDRLLKQLKDAKIELNSVLVDWNAIVSASGSKTHGGAVGHVAQMRTELEAVKAELSMCQNKLELSEEEIEVLHLNLDDMGLPRKTSDELSMWGRVTYIINERDALRASIEAAEKQEPVAYRAEDLCGNLVYRNERNDFMCLPLYAMPPMPAQQYSEYPMQPIIDGRFEANPIVDMLVDKVGLNEISVWWQINEIPIKYTEQLAQLIGYSIGGYSELDYVSDESYERAVKLSEQKNG